MYVSIIAMIINVIGNYFLIPILGAMGAAISTALSFWFFYLLRTECSRKVWRNIPRRKAYLITLLLLFTLIVNAIFFDDSKVSLLIWLVLALLGFFIFRVSICFIYNKLTRCRI